MNTLASKGPHSHTIRLFVEGSIELEKLSFGSYTKKVNKIRFGEVQIKAITLAKSSVWVKN